MVDWVCSWFTSLMIPNGPSFLLPMQMPIESTMAANFKGYRAWSNSLWLTVISTVILSVLTSTYFAARQQLHGLYFASKLVAGMIKPLLAHRLQRLLLGKKTNSFSLRSGRHITRIGLSLLRTCRDVGYGSNIYCRRCCCLFDVTWLPGKNPGCRVGSVLVCFQSL